LLAVGLTVAALIVHGVVIVALFGMSTLLQAATPAVPDVGRIVVSVVDPPAPVAEPAPELAPEPEVTPPVAPPPKPKPKRKAKRRAPPPDPIDRPETPPDPPREEVRRVVGLDSQATVEGGAGPAFASGNTRMGVTAKTAEDPGAVDKLPAGARGARPANRVATRVPTRKSSRARRSGQKIIPIYLKSLKRRGIEGNVQLLVTIDVAGRTSSVRVAKGSGYPSLDQAAMEAARRQRWKPATVDGRKTVSRERYMVRFRIRE
jgi:protein TonB